MREIGRINEILELVKQLWLKDPDLRFNQLVYNLQQEYSSQNESMGQVIEVVDETYKRIGFDMFNVEDDSFTIFLHEKVSGDS